MSSPKLHSTKAVDGVWPSVRSVEISEIPSNTDVLNYAFANLTEYDSDKPIFIEALDPSTSVTANQARQIVFQLINGLKAVGLKEGDCVCLHTFNSIWYPLIWLGVLGCGGCVVGSNPRYTKLELLHLLDLTKPKFIFTQVDVLQPIAEAAAAARSKIASSRIFVLDTYSHAPLERGYASWRTLLLGQDDSGPVTRKHKSDPDGIAMYGMTSGTTGLPKAAMISQRALVSQTALIEGQFRARPYEPSQLVCLPVFHAFASPLALVLPLRLGLTTFFLPKWSLSEYLRAVETYAITDSPVSPPIIGALIQLLPSEHPRLGSLRCVISAGAALPATVQGRLYDILAPEAVVAQVWGTTEAGWHSLGDLQQKDRTGSVGRLLKNVQMKLIGENGALITDEGQPGEALIRTPMLFSGYLNNQEAREDTFDSDGFYRTGDQVYVQDDILYYTDRLKDTMKVKGWQVSPTELESTLIQHPQIVDAAVVGVKHTNTAGIPETFPTAFVVRARGNDAAPLAQREVKNFVAARLISYKHISGDVIFIKAVPRSASGKILRRKLFEAEQDLSAKVSMLHREV